MSRARGHSTGKLRSPGLLRSVEQVIAESLETRCLLSYGFEGNLSFDGTSGSSPNSRPLIISTANGEDIFGTAASGGANGYGAVFLIVDNNQDGPPPLSAVYSFTNGADGGTPHGGLIADTSGNLYGTTWTGGANGKGTIYKMTPNGSSYTLSTLASFGGTGAIDPSGLTIDGSGNLYGTTRNGGTNGLGSVFKLAAGTSTIATIYSFTGAADGSHPYAGVNLASGVFYGTTTAAGGTSSSGTIYSLNKTTNAFTTLYSFNGPVDGASPHAGVYRDGSGNLFGEAYSGGSAGLGTAFELPNGSSTLQVLVTFSGANGANPAAGLAHDAQGNLLGTTDGGGAGGYGTVFELVSGTTFVPVYSFAGGNDGSGPNGLGFDGATGALYGTTSLGGQNNDGTAYKLAAATKVSFQEQPGTATAGQTISPDITVDVESSDGGTMKNDTSTITLSILSGPPGAVLSGTTSVAAQNGTADFSGLSLSLPGQYTLQATDGTLTSATMQISVASNATQLAFTQQPNSGNVGLALAQIQVELEDSQGHQALGDTSSVMLSIKSGSPGASLVGITTVQAQNGIATFSGLAFTQPGTYTLQAIHASDSPLPIAISDSIVVTVVGTRVSFVQAPTNVTAGDSMPDVTVAIQDPYGDTDTTDNSLVTLTLTSGQFVGGGNAVSVAAVSGIATFSGLQIATAGPLTFTASDGTLNSGTSGVFSVNPAAPDHLVFTTQPSVAFTGFPAETIAVSVADRFGNVVTGGNSSVTIAVDTGPTTTLGGTLTVAAVNGVATFNGVSFNALGAYTLMAIGSGLGGATSNSISVNVPFAALTGGALVVSGTVSNDTIGVALSGATLNVTENGQTLPFVYAGITSITINGMAGNDAITVDASVPKAVMVSGGDGNDTITGGIANDSLYGNGGNDVINGGGGADFINGGAGNDTLYGGAGADTLMGGNGRDYEDGQGGNDNVQGQAGADTLYGGSGLDTITGGAGADLIYGGAGNDTIYVADFVVDTVYVGGGTNYVSHDAADIIVGYYITLA